MCTEQGTDLLLVAGLERDWGRGWSLGRLGADGTYNKQKKGQVTYLGLAARRGRARTKGSPRCSPWALALARPPTRSSPVLRYSLCAGYILGVGGVKLGNTFNKPTNISFANFHRKRTTVV